MEDDDEFGDLYTDVLQPFASSSSSPPPPPSISNPSLPPASPDSPIIKQPQSPPQREIPQFADSANLSKEPDADSIHQDVKFDIEEEADVGGIGSEPVIPGLSGGDVAASGAPGRIDERGEGDDWDDDSDSDDDLQIVLNDNSMIGMERDGMMVDGGDDEDGGLNIVAGGELNQGAEEQEWGENTAQVDGERKDSAELGKGSGGVTAAPKIGYGHQGYHPPFHSHFKYVRPGAAPMPGATATPGGPPGQIRPLANVNPVAGRGRGDWRPAGIKGAAAMQKGFHAGPGLPVWGNSATGRGFGGGMEFTLPSHKTIFDVDIDSFEEKPWKYPGVDLSVFFNFDLNEDSWKDYCKQLEQLRLESTMQSKIRVYESGRTEQEFDPDLPPELAAATGVHDVPVENANSVKPDVGQSELMKGSGPLRPPIPTGRAIQVEGGYGERLPTIDTRPPRVRDTDAIIEIVLQDTADDVSPVGIDVQDQPEGGEPQREDSREDNVVQDDIPRGEPEYFAGFPKDHNGQKRELVGRRMLLMSSNHANSPDEDENLLFPQDEPVDYSDSRRQTPRQMQGRAHGRSSRITPRREMTIVDNKKEELVASMENRHSAHLSPSVSKDAKESSMEDKDPELEETGTYGGSSRLEKEDDIDTRDNRDALKDEVRETQKLTSRAEQPLLEEGDDWEDSKAARSSDNSKARSASSREYQKHREGFEEEVAQDPGSMQQGSIRQQSDENGQVFDKRDHGGRQEPDRNHMVIKGREESWTQRDDDLYSRKGRNDEPRKRARSKVRGENERSNKDDSIHSRKQLDNGSYRVTYDKDIGSRVSRHRERDDGLKGRHEGAEDFHSKKRKDEEYLRREHIYKEEIPHGYRENTSRHRRERDDVLDLRKRDGHQRSRDNVDDQYAAWQKDEAWLLRERGDRQRDREEWNRREREEGRSSVRSGRGVEEKTWVGHVRAKDEYKVSEKEYQSAEAMRHSDQLKRRDRVLGESPHHRGRDDAYVRGIQYSSEEKRPRQEKSSRHNDRVANASDNHRVHERKHKEGSRKSKEPVVGSFSSPGISKRSQEDQGGQINERGSKGSGDEQHVEHEIPGHHLSRKHQDDVFSDNEQQDSQRGRSKLERWTSNKERDFTISSKASSSLKFKDLGKDNNDGSSEAGKPVDESAKIVDTDNQGLALAEGKDYVDMESKDADTKGLGDRHLDTVEKLKKRSERFKLPMPMPSERESIVIKKIESEPLPSAKSENPVDSEVKQERPARKRRWISN